MEPNGPLPPQIYWRRRALAIGAAVIALVLLIWAISALVGGGDDPAEADAAAVTSSLTSEVSFTPNPSGSNSSGGNGGGGNGGGGTGDSGSNGSATSAAATSTTSATSAAPVPAGQCADSSLAVKATADKPTFAGGEEPTFTIVITNIGSAACDRDLAGGLQQVLVYSIDGKNRLWSNVDCYPQPAPDVRNLEPGEQAAFKVAWSATTSTPDCATSQNPQRNPVGPGAYTVVGQLGALRSGAEPFNIA